MPNPISPTPHLLWPDVPMQWLAALQAPLSGAVTQWIRAWGQAVGQIGLLNVNIGNSADPELEREISSRYSYGRQLGRMLDMLLPLVRINESALRKEIGDQPVNEFVAMATDIQARKRLNVDDIVDKVRSWEQSDAYQRDLAELIERLEALKAVPSEAAPTTNAAGSGSRDRTSRASPQRAVRRSSGLRR